MTIEEMEREISEIPRFGTYPGLENLQQYLDALGHPEKDLKVIHVAGTNGKGSVCAFLESMLRKAGYRTALFTSPHLVHMNERFRIDFQICEDDKLIWAWEQVKSLLAERDGQRKPLTYFEILFLMSLLIFSRENVDYCIMETGLGGRLDATVLTNPLICVITSISFDHMAVLGDTMEAIASEKAGIIKPGIPVVALDEGNGSFPTIQKEAERKHSPLYRVLSNDITILKKRENKIDFSIKSRYYKNSYLSIRSAADYQIYNAALAFIAMRVLLPDIEEQTLRAGLMEMRWEGRMEQVLPDVYVDGAHNPGAIMQICRMFADDGMDAGRWQLLFAVCADKDYDEMVRMLSEISWSIIYITRLEGTRGVALKEMEACFRRYTKCPLISFEDANQALQYALQHKKNEEGLLCLGSFYLVGEIKRRMA
ncbi:MAG: bifunctional folylpolyglutamate synthase/dihydrofolate synthase [Clostridiales bacterium]|nr:bifunctional folylpolyglutamate synthase/dihydrofolate synthase [Clostridiales bacterium]